jgi:hypothetical protein
VFLIRTITVQRSSKAQNAMSSINQLAREARKRYKKRALVRKNHSSNFDLQAKWQPEPATACPDVETEARHRRGRTATRKRNHLQRRRRRRRSNPKAHRMSPRQSRPPSDARFAGWKMIFWRCRTTQGRISSSTCIATTPRLTCSSVTTNPRRTGPATRIHPSSRPPSAQEASRPAFSAQAEGLTSFTPTQRPF